MSATDSSATESGIAACLDVVPEAIHTFNDPPAPAPRPAGKSKIDTADERAVPACLLAARQSPRPDQC